MPWIEQPKIFETHLVGGYEWEPSIKLRSCGPNLTFDVEIESDYEQMEFSLTRERLVHLVAALQVFLEGPIE